MPLLDGTGPQGQGRKTGRRQGKCANQLNDNNSNEVCYPERTTGRAFGRKKMQKKRCQSE